MSQPGCPKCGGTMEGGFVLDRTKNSRTQALWIEGAPEKSFWTGVRLRGKARRPILTQRCQRCGYLESYARP